MNFHKGLLKICYVFSSSFLTNRNFPKYNLGLKVDVERKNKNIHTDIDIKYGDDHRNKTKSVTVLAIYDQHSKNAIKSKFLAKVYEKVSLFELNMYTF